MCLFKKSLKRFEIPKYGNFFSRIVKCCAGIVGDSSEKSQKPLYSKLEIFPKTQEKSPTSILRLLPSYTSTKVVPGVSSKGKSCST